MTTSIVLSGEEFNDKYKNYEFYKLLYEDLNHHDFTYKNGLNEDTKQFNPTNKCSEGGLYFTEKEKLPMWISSYYFGTNREYRFITRCFIPNDANVCVGNCKFKSDKLIVDIENKITIENSLLWNDENFCKKAVKYNGLLLEFVKNQTDEICKIAVSQSGIALKFVNEQTYELCKIACDRFDYSYTKIVKYSKNGFYYVNDKTDEICKMVLQKCGNQLLFVENQTENMCKLAVNQNGLALKHVKEQTDEICKLAIQQNVNAFQFVRNKTEELCKLYEQNKK